MLKKTIDSDMQLRLFNHCNEAPQNLLTEFRVISHIQGLQANAWVMPVLTAVHEVHAAQQNYALTTKPQTCLIYNVACHGTTRFHNDVKEITTMH